MALKQKGLLTYVFSRPWVRDGGYAIFIGSTGKDAHLFPHDGGLGLRAMA